MVNTTTVSHVDIIRQSLSAKRFSDEVIRIINVSWSTGTDKRYNTVWERWCGRCKERQIDTVQASINEVQLSIFLLIALLMGEVIVPLILIDQLCLVPCVM